MALDAQVRIKIPQGEMIYTPESDGSTRVEFQPNDQHRWLNNLRCMMQVLNHEIILPHNIYECNECSKARSLQMMFLKETTPCL